MDLLQQRLDMARKIAAGLTGTLSQQDREILEQWLAEDVRHQDEYKEIRRLLASDESVWVEMEQAGQIAEQRWQKLQPKAKGVLRMWKRWGRYAALIVLLLAVGGYWRMQREPDQSIVEKSLPHFLPGAGKSFLTLSGGETILLTDTTRMQVEERNGTAISMEERLVKYTPKDTLTEEVGEEYNTLTVPRGGEYALLLADGTRVWLNAESSLRYPVHFTGAQRRVEMTGEVCFEVAKDTLRPFIVTARDIEVKVLGTYFNVSAYNEEVVTTLINGKVRLEKGNEQVVLLAGQQGVPTAHGFEVKQVDAGIFVLWKDGVFCFEDAPLETILDALARWYDVHVFYQNPGLKDTRYSVKIKRYGNIDEILRRIAQTNRVRFEIKNRTINVYE